MNVLGKYIVTIITFFIINHILCSFLSEYSLLNIFPNRQISWQKLQFQRKCSLIFRLLFSIRGEKKQRILDEMRPLSLNLVLTIRVTFVLVTLNPRRTLGCDIICIEVANGKALRLSPNLPCCLYLKTETCHMYDALMSKNWRYQRTHVKS